MGYELIAREGSFSNIEHIVPRSLVEKIFERLNEGVEYYDDKGKFMGRIMAVNGPLGIIQVISEHYLDTENKPHITIEVRYLNEIVLHLLIDDDSLLVYKFAKSWWEDKL